MGKDLENGKKELAIVPPPLLFSARLSFFILCLFATLNFMLLRININFALICMVKPSHHHLHHNASVESNNGINFTENSLGEQFSSVLNKSLHLSDESQNFDFKNNSIHSIPIYDEEFEEEEFCVALEDSKNKTKAKSPFEDGEFEWDKGTQANILGSFYYGYLFTQILGGWVSDRFGGSKGLILTVGALSILTLLNPIASVLGPEYLFLIRMLQGLSQGAAVPLLNVLSARWSGHTERGFLMSVAYGGFSIGAFISNPICAFVCRHFGWSSIFYITGGIGVLWCIAAHFLIFDWPEAHPRISEEELNFLKKNRAVHPSEKHQTKKLYVPWCKIFLSGPVNVVHIAHFCTIWTFTTISMYIPAFMKEVLKMDIEENGILSSIPFLGMLILHWIVGVLFDAIRRKQVLSITNLRKIFNTVGLLPVVLSLSLFSTIPCRDNYSTIIPIFLFLSFGELSISGGYMFSIFEIAPRFSGILTGISNTVGVLPGFLVPIVVGHITNDGSRDEWLIVFYIATGITGFGCLIYLLFGSSELQSWAAPPPQKKTTEMKVLEQKLIAKEKNGDSLLENR